MGEVTPLSLPQDLPYPITITTLNVGAGTTVRRGDRLLEYSFLSSTRHKEIEALERQRRDVPDDMRKNDMVGSWESPIDGDIVSWVNSIQRGVQIERRHANKPILKVEQPCTHPVQFNGMCGVCGANIVNDDYLSRPAQNEAGPSRYPGSFELAHDASGVTVSTSEAQRLETQTRDALLAARKLSLIVDLDQTIIHTTVDPTVGEWLDECAEDAKAQAAAAESKGGKDAEGDETMNDEAVETTTPPGSPRPAHEPNPNAEALKDVARFQLAEDLPPGAVKGRGRNQPPARWYYTKPRPGLNDFLHNLSELYEMHVYTMGTRTYADAICKIIDPEGKIFGGRILSRDESGSMSAKSLVRLFPTDQSMVVIIDDRSDVWGDSPNLVKVVPYDFFIGIGDINGSFLPPTQPTVTAPPGQAQTPGSDRSNSSAASTPPPSTPTDIPSTEDGLMLQSKILDDMTEARPLARLQQETDEKAEGEAEAAAASKLNEGDEVKDGLPAKGISAAAEQGNQDKPHTPHVLKLGHHHHHHRRQLLNPHDTELDRVGRILRTIHTQYYEAYDGRDPASKELPMQCDAPLLIQELKDQVLQGCVIAFTGVIPRNIQPEHAEIWQQAEAFGAICVHDLSDRLTHLVTASLGTEKMYRAAKMPGVKTVWLAWLQACIALWKHEPEAPFRATHPSVEDVREREPSPEAEEEEEMGDEGDEIRQESAAFDANWDEAAQAEFEKFLEDGSDDDSSTIDGRDADERADPEGSKSPISVIDEDEERKTWSRASTPGPSILSRAPSPGRETPKNVQWADEENLPLERVRETKPGELVSYPPRKKRRVNSALLLTAPTDDDDIPEANRMQYHAKPWELANGSHEDGASEGAGSEVGASGDENDDDDEFAQMLSDSLADEQ